MTHGPPRDRGKAICVALIQAGCHIAVAKGRAAAGTKAEARIQTENPDWISPAVCWLEPDLTRGPSAVRAEIGDKSGAPRAHGRPEGRTPCYFSKIADPLIHLLGWTHSGARRVRIFHAPVSVQGETESRCSATFGQCWSPSWWQARPSPLSHAAQPSVSASLCTSSACFLSALTPSHPHP